MKTDGETNECVVYCYSRREALECGLQIDVSQLATEAGINIPTFITRSVFERYVAVPSGVFGQDEVGRLWDIICMFLFALRRGPADVVKVSFELRVRNSNEEIPERVRLIAECAALDFNDPTPALTIMLPADN